MSLTIANRFINPIAFDKGQAAAALNSRFDRVWTSIGGAVLAVHYENAVLANGVVASQADRSGDIERIPFRAIPRRLCHRALDLRLLLNLRQSPRLRGQSL